MAPEIGPKSFGGFEKRTPVHKENIASSLVNEFRLFHYETRIQ